MKKNLSHLVPGDYVFFIPGNQAYLITEKYEDGKYMTCALEALTLYSKYYRIATKKEIAASKKHKEEFQENARKIWEYIAKSEEDYESGKSISNVTFESSNNCIQTRDQYLI